MLKLQKIIEYLFYLFVFLLPWQTRWIWHYGYLGSEVSQYLSLSLYASQLVLLLIFLLVIIYKLKNPDDEAKVFNIRLIDFYILLGLFLLASVLSVFFAADKQVAVYHYLDILTGFALVIFIINFKFSFKKLGLVFVAAGLVQAVLGIYQFLSQTIWASKWLGMAQQLTAESGVSVVESETMRWLRAYGSLPHPNILAGFLAVCLIILLVILFLNIKPAQKIFVWLSMPILISGLFFTFCKSAILAFLIGWFFISLFVWVNKNQQLKLIWVNSFLVMLTTSCLLVLIYQDPVLTRLQGDTRLEQKSVTERTAYFEQGRELVQNNYLFGIGPGNYTLALYNQDQDKQPAWYYQPVHNVYFMVVAEIGLLGFILFMVLIIEIFRRIYHFKFIEYSGLIKVLDYFKEKSIAQEYKNKLYWFLAYATIFLMLLVIMVFDHYLWTLYFGIMLFWLCLGLLLKQISLLK